MVYSESGQLTKTLQTPRPPCSNKHNIVVFEEEPKPNKFGRSVDTVSSFWFSDLG